MSAPTYSAIGSPIFKVVIGSAGVQDDVDAATRLPISATA
jgi:hypothetical protein